MGRMNLSKKQPAKNIAAGPPTKKEMDENGVIQEIPQCPLFHKKMLAPNGDPVDVPLGTGYTVRGLGAHNPYGIQKLQEKLDKGYLPFDECPLRSAHPMVLAMKMKGEPCDPKSIDKDHPCKHLQHIMVKRQEAYQGKESAFVNNFASSGQKQNDLLQKLLQQAIEAGQGPAKGKMGV